MDQFIGKPPGFPKKQGPFTQGGYNLDIAVHPDNSDIVFLGLIGYYRSTSGFHESYIRNDHHETYNLSGIIHADLHAFAFDPNNPEVMYIANDGGINKTIQSSYPNPTPDTPIVPPYTNNYFTLNNNGLAIAQCYDIALANEAVYAGTQDQSAWLGVKEQDNWVQYPGGDVTKAVSSKDGKVLIYNTSSGRNEMIRNMDPEFKTVYNRGAIDLSEDGFLHGYAFDPANLYRFAAVRTDTIVIIDDANAFYQNPASYAIRKVPLEGRMTPTSAFALSSYPIGTLYAATVGRSEEFSTRNFRSSIMRTENLYTAPAISALPNDDYPDADISDIYVNRYNADRLIVSFSNYHSSTKIILFTKWRPNLAKHNRQPSFTRWNGYGSNGTVNSHIGQ